MTVVAVLLPRFELSVAAGGGAALLRGPSALAPMPGTTQGIGEVSAAAEAFGVRRGMAMGEALARCPRLALVPPDPAGVAEAWEEVLARLEGIGAAVAPGRPGQVCFAADGLRGLHGGGVRGVVAAAVRALRRPARLGAGPGAFCALAAATRARVVRPALVEGGPAQARAYLGPLEVGLLSLREAAAPLVEPLERLGIATLGALAALPRDAVADRFGYPGLHAHDLARGHDEPLRPRRPFEVLRESLELPEAASGPQLEQALGLLVDRLVARGERRGRTLRAVALSAVLVEGGTWRERVTFREALADPQRMRLALAPRLALLPAPADALRLAVESFGPPVTDQRPLLDEAAAVREGRLREVVRQTRALAGTDAALRVVEVDPGSRVPERRAILAPFEGREGAP
ncbi:MAG: protein ImuB [Solirubrobacteraceae bacterium]|jgi:protein ImuB|nr:protein ImuB [Solirubrobacteraceae bacterium]